MKTKFTQSVLMLFLVVGLFVMGVREVEGKSVTSFAQYNGYLNYCWDNFTGGCAVADPYAGWYATGYSNWGPGLDSPSVSVTYHAQVKNNGIVLNPDIANTVAVGDQLTFEAMLHQNTDISWFGTGYSYDSPYGHWSVNAALPPGYMCDPGNFTNDTGWGLYPYISYAVNPPAIIYNHTGSTAGLSCDGVGRNCTVTSPGAIIGNVNFAQTDSKFYYGYTGWVAGCMTNPHALREAILPYPAGYVVNIVPYAIAKSSPFILPIPAQTISFNLTAVSNNNPPATPTITVDAPSKNVNTDFTFTAQSTDPDGDTLKYGFDFTGSAATPGLYVPSTATLASGTAQSALYQWPVAGTYTVRVRAEDNRGGVSGWSTPVTVTVNAFPPDPIINSFTINGSTGSVNLLRGDMRNIAWNVSNAVSCSASSGDIWSGNKSVPTGNDALPANVTTPHTLDCVNVLGTHTSSTIQVNVSCNPSTGTFGSCACATETKTRTNTSALCISVIESASCDVDEKKACRNFNWTEGSP